MYHASIQKHARIRHLARKGASRGSSQSLYPSLLKQSPVKQFTLASQSLPVPNDMAIDKDAIVNANISAHSVPNALHEDQTIILSDASTCAEVDPDTAIHHPYTVQARIKKLSSNTILSDHPDTLSDTSTSAEYDADAESESDITCVDLDKIASILWVEGPGFWVHDFALVRQFEEEKRIADMTGGGEECFAAEYVEKEENISEGIKAWIESRFSIGRKENLKKDGEEELAKEEGVRKLSDM
ncbi:uncharacterized protein Bfra_007825 [Botrytis fragariae]|uniref:Uncharacterized protein n=1 Tax=Botrytis fragariae TaxID=1964551 RepID=A0A8H6APX0_9HELO|nr:uncharacterized protein Bfra_007825 [Botrytis fragariae]KAF5871309.1 hypothetical protein Bfra_007825 [Botrytis fragariae]